jgi:hypothetical protein
MNSHAAEPFFEQVRTRNPFLTNRVDRPLTEEPMDVFGIHDAEYRRILSLGRQAHSDNRGFGVVVWGEAGVGKTHMLARLGRWSRERQQACFVYLHNLQADPAQVPADVLEATLNILTSGRRRPWYCSSLFHVINGAAKAALAAQKLERPSWAQLAGAFDCLVQQMADQDPSRGVVFQRSVYDVLFRFFQAAHPQQQGKQDMVADLALRWLGGVPLTAAELSQLGLNSGADNAQAQPETETASRDPRSSILNPRSSLASRQHAKQVLVALTQLARAAGQLFLLCFDQVDNLEENQIQALSRFLHDLLDSAGNLLVVTTGVRETLFGFRKRGLITETSWDRLGQVEIPLNRLPRERARDLLLSRLQRFLQCARGLPEIEDVIREDPLFPLGSAWLEKRLKDVADFRPRDLLSWAGQRWQEHQDVLTTTPGTLWLTRLRVDTNGRAPTETKSPNLDSLLERLFAEHVQIRQRAPQQLPPGEEKLQELAVAVLEQCAKSDLFPALVHLERGLSSSPNARSTYDLVAHQRCGPGGSEVRVGLRFLVTSNGNAAGAVLRRLHEDDHPPDLTLLVTVDRQPLQLGRVGKGHLEKLRERGVDGFRHLELTFQEHVELDALAHLLHLAAEGRMQTMLTGSAAVVSMDDVLKVLQSQGRFQSHRLLQPFLACKVRVPVGVAAVGAN